MRHPLYHNVTLTLCRERGQFTEQGGEMFDEIRAYLLAKPGAQETYPFGPEPLVAKVGEKVFALLSPDDPPQLSLKCDPLYAEDLRALYPAIRPGYHLNKRHWNTVALDGTVPDALVSTLIDESYLLVVRGLPRALRERFLAGARAE